MKCRVVIDNLPCEPHEYIHAIQFIPEDDEDQRFVNEFVEHYDATFSRKENWDVVYVSVSLCRIDDSGNIVFP